MSAPAPALVAAVNATESFTVKQAAVNAARRTLAVLDAERSRLQGELSRNDEERQATRSFLATLEK